MGEKKVSANLFRGLIIQCLYEQKLYLPLMREYLRNIEPNIDFYLNETPDNYIIKAKYNELSYIWKTVKPFNPNVFGYSLQFLKHFCEMIGEKYPDNVEKKEEQDNQNMQAVQEL